MPTSLPRVYGHRYINTSLFLPREVSDVPVSLPRELEHVPHSLPRDRGSVRSRLFPVVARVCSLASHRPVPRHCWLRNITASLFLPREVEHVPFSLPRRVDRVPPLLPSVGAVFDFSRYITASLSLPRRVGDVPSPASVSRSRPKFCTGVCTLRTPSPAKYVIKRFPLFYRGNAESPVTALGPAYILISVFLHIGRSTPQPPIWHPQP